MNQWMVLGNLDVPWRGLHKAPEFLHWIFRFSESARPKIALCPTTSFAARSFSESGIAPAPFSIAPVLRMMRPAPARVNDYQARPVNGQLIGEPNHWLSGLQ
jgi:hypothetical protein